MKEFLGKTALHQRSSIFIEVHNSLSFCLFVYLLQLGLFTYALSTLGSYSYLLSSLIDQISLPHSEIFPMFAQVLIYLITLREAAIIKFLAIILFGLLSSIWLIIKHLTMEVPNVCYLWNSIGHEWKFPGILQVRSRKQVSVRVD